MDENVKFRDKKLSDLTVGDTVKVTLWTTAASVAVPVVIGFGIAGVEIVKSNRRERKMKKFNAPLTSDE